MAILASRWKVFDECVELGLAQRLSREVVGMSPFWKPFAIKALGSTIDCLMKAASLPLRTLSRSGPDLPVAPASASVWQPAQPLAGEDLLAGARRVRPPPPAAAAAAAAAGRSLAEPVVERWAGRRARSRASRRARGRTARRRRPGRSRAVFGVTR